MLPALAREIMPSRKVQRILAAASEIGRGGVHLAKRASGQTALRRRRLGDWNSRQELNQACRAASQLMKLPPPGIRDEARDPAATSGKMLEQIDEERQVGLLHPLLIERQDEPAGGGFDEVITILNPLGNALCGDQLADLVSGEKRGHLFSGDVGIDGQVNWLRCYSAIRDTWSAS